MEVALDDYIKTKNITRSGRGRRGAKPGRGGVAAARGGKKTAGARTPRFSRGVTKKSAGRTPQSGGRSNISRMAAGDRWQHDLFGAAAATGRGLRSNSAGTAKLLISNLEFGVSDTDINDLFMEFGPLKKASVHYDRSGRSIGTAEVIFIRAGDAMSAMRKYNGVPLDGRPMDIQLVTAGGGVPVSPLAPNRVGGGRGGSRAGFTGRPARGARGGAARGRGGKPGGRGAAQRRPAKPDVTQEQLDMELDEYQASAAT